MKETHVKKEHPSARMPYFQKTLIKFSLIKNVYQTYRKPFGYF